MKLGLDLVCSNFECKNIKLGTNSLFFLKVYPPLKF